MKINFIYHVPFEGAGEISTYFKKSDSITETRMWEFINFDYDADLYVIMGGPLSVNDIGIYPWLIDELGFMKKQIDKGKKILGICLGAQLIAKALGAEVYQNHKKEIGWFPVQFTFKQKHIFPSEAIVFHWHSETFNLPSGSTSLGSSKACGNQGFIYKDNVIGLQFHLEMNKKAVLSLIKNCGSEIAPDEYIQSAEEMKKELHFQKNGNKNILTALLDYLTE